MKIDLDKTCSQRFGLRHQAFGEFYDRAYPYWLNTSTLQRGRAIRRLAEHSRLPPCPHYSRGTRENTVNLVELCSSYSKIVVAMKESFCLCLLAGSLADPSYRSREIRQTS
jgi:hypothetical protein